MYLEEIHHSEDKEERCRLQYGEAPRFWLTRATPPFLHTTKLQGCLDCQIMSISERSNCPYAATAWRSFVLSTAPHGFPATTLPLTSMEHFGLDPLGLREDHPETLKWYVQAELVHARFAMAGVSGILVTDLLRVTGINNLPVWFEAGATNFNFANTTTLFVVQLLLMGFAETKRYMDFRNPRSQSKEGSFFGLEAALEGLDPG